MARVIAVVCRQAAHLDNQPVHLTSFDDSGVLQLVPRICRDGGDGYPDARTVRCRHCGIEIRMAAETVRKVHAAITAQPRLLTATWEGAPALTTDMLQSLTLRSSKLPVLKGPKQ